MPNKPSAKKELRKSHRRTTHAVRIRTHVKALWKFSRELLAQGKQAEAKEKVRLLQQALDKAAKTHVIHRNVARRKKAALMKRTAGVSAR